MSGAPNSRFMNELLVICPTHPQFTGSWRKREEPLHERDGQRILPVAVE